MAKGLVAIVPIVLIVPIKNIKTMKLVIKERIEALRELMRREKLDAFIFPSTDPHNGEYVPSHWEGRKWITGFDGSAGTAVVTMHEAALWTDSRYFIAAEEQLAGTGIQLMKERMPETPTIPKWLGMKLVDDRDPYVGIDGSVCSAAMVMELTKELRSQGGIALHTSLDPLARIWKDRPSLPDSKVVIHPLEYSGESCASKLERIRAALRQKHAGGMLVAALDDIAWVLNLRGSDVHCNPVFVAYLLIEPKKATLFIDQAKLSKEVVNYLKGEGVSVDDYDVVKKRLRYYGEYNILADPNEINHTLYNAIECVKVDAPSPIPAMKALKNDTEIEGFRNAMVRDGVAMVKFLYWLKTAPDTSLLSELSVSERLERERSRQDKFRGISFDTIAAYGAHGAIVHYEPTKESNVKLQKEGLLLLDSGAQYLDGTTDITRTIALGPLAEEQKRVYTLVLKGHIQLQMLKFPHGASGTQLDAVARMAMWGQGMNFMHGTGHGVGSYLCVHEGPHQIRMEYRPAPLLPGMVVTDEPGLYLSGRFGVRIENILLVKSYMSTEFGEFLQFETLTLCPIDKEPIIVEMLSEEEKKWLDDYHLTVRDKLSRHLTFDERSWLEEVTKPLA